MLLVLILGWIIYAIYQAIEESSWNTHAYDNKEYDVQKAYKDSVKLYTGEITKSQYKENYTSGKYSK